MAEKEDYCDKSSYFYVDTPATARQYFILLFETICNRKKMI